MIKSVLALGAHPDDETMLVGGTLAMLSKQGIKVHVLSATGGEGGDLGDPPVANRAELGAARERELRCAAQALGAASVRTLAYIDPLVGPGEELFPFEADFETLVGQIQDLIREVKADVLLSHGQDGEYGHPAHKLVYQAARAAVEGFDSPLLFYTYAAKVPGIEDHLWNENDPAHFALDIHPWLDGKEAAALCHVSQHALFRRKHPGETFREVLRKTEGLRRQLPAVDGPRPQDRFADLLLAVGAVAPEDF